MSRNPYAPPTASVADPPSVSIPRPLEVTLAVRLQWLSFILGFASGVMRESWSNGWVVAAVSIAIYAAIVAWLIFKLGRGRNWARIVYTVLVLLGYVSIVTSWHVYIAAYPGHRELLALDILDTLADIGGLYFIYTKAANAWFRPRAVQ